MDQPRAHAALGSDPIRTIGRDELKAMLERGGDFKLIMALSRWAFDAKHIPGSLHFDTPDELYAAVRPDDDVVVYCSNVDCLSSVALYRDLVRRGYGNVRRYAGGLLEGMEGQPWEVAWVQAQAARTWMLEVWYGLREPSDEAAWWIRKGAAEHYAEHLDRLREWTDELIARRPTGG